jgi:hypothetical protein
MCFGESPYVSNIQYVLCFFFFGCDLFCMLICCGEIMLICMDFAFDFYVLMILTNFLGRVGTV